MTYLEIVNAVLRRLREDQATTVNESDYSQLIGDLVNEAKTYVENSWDWSGLRNTTNITTTAGTSEYALTGYGIRSEVFDVFNETDNYVIPKAPLKEIRKLTMQTDDANNKVTAYAMSGVDANGDIKLRLFPTPSSADSISVYGVKRTDKLVNDADSVNLPSNCIVNWAYAYALVERGETGGDSGAEQFLIAKNTLSDAISLDAGLHADELNWETV